MPRRVSLIAEPGSPRSLLPCVSMPETLGFLKSSLALLAFLSTACHQVVHPASTIHMADRKSDFQLLDGFYPPEASQWRWTSKDFSVMLQPPAGAESKGALLQVDGFVPPVQTDKLGAMTLRANAGGTVLAPEIFARAGAFHYTRDIEPAILRTNLLPIRFSLDKASPPGPDDSRELGLVVNSIGLVTK